MVKNLVVLSFACAVPVLGAVADNHGFAADAGAQGQAAMKQSETQLDAAGKQVDAAMADAKKQLEGAAAQGAHGQAVLDGKKAMADANARQAKAMNDSHAAMKAGAAQVDAAAANHMGAKK